MDGIYMSYSVMQCHAKPRKTRRIHIELSKVILLL